MNIRGMFFRGVINEHDWEWPHVTSTIIAYPYKFVLFVSPLKEFLPILRYLVLH